jgi:hypothetical protein
MEFPTSQYSLLQIRLDLLYQVEPNKKYKFLLRSWAWHDDYLDTMGWE